METERHRHNLIRVDSTIVSDTTGKLTEGISNVGKKAVKFSVAFDGALPCELKTFIDSCYSSEDIALPEVVLNHVKKDGKNQNIYVLDRGLQSTRTMKSFTRDAIIYMQS